MKYIINLIKKRNLSKREKVLLIIFSVIFILWISSTFILKPQADKIQSLELDVSKLDDEITYINQLLSNENRVKEDLNNLKSEIVKIGNSYFSTLDQTQLIYYLEDVIGDNGLTIIDMVFSNVELLEIDDYEIPYIDISIPFEGEYNEIADVIKHINNGPFKIIIESLSLNDMNKEIVEGEMIVKIFSIEDIINIPINNMLVIPEENDEIYEDFHPFEDDIEENNENAEVDSVTQNGASNSQNTTDDSNRGEPVEEKDPVNRIILNNFDNSSYEFISSHEAINGNVNSYKHNKSNYLRFEYSIKSSTNQDNIAYIDMNKQNIEFRHPIFKLNLKVKSYNYSFGNLGIRFRTPDGENIDAIISEGISWTGWNDVEFGLPSKLSLYPLELTHIYYEVPANREDIGVLVFDKLEMLIANKSMEVNDFYMVKTDDTITSISKEIYGSDKYVNEILENNNLSSPDGIFPGKILILRRR